MPSLGDGVYYVVNMSHGSAFNLGEQPIYRLYNPYTGQHFYTASFYEYTHLGAVGWSMEGVAFRTSGNGSVPMYRLYNPYNGQHLYTLSKQEHDSLVGAGWQSEGVGFKVDENGDYPVYRLYNSHSGEHFYTASKFEYDSLVRAGWNGEGVGFNAFGIPCLDSASCSGSNGVNVYNAALCYATSQAWALRTRTDGSRQLVNRGAGRSLDVASAVAGGNVQMWTDTPSRAQSWDVEPTGDTATIGGQAATVCKVTLHGKPLALDLAGDVIGSNAVVRTPSSEASQEWAFLPVSLLQSEHVYELRAMTNTKVAVDVPGASNTQGTGLQLYSANGGNSQKFWLCDEGDGWSIRNIASGLYLDSNGENIRTGAQVIQWKPNGGANQRWHIEERGTTVVDGKTCKVVSFGAHNVNDYQIGYADPSAASSCKLVIDNGVASSSQLFALLETDALDPHVPTATDVFLNSRVGVTNSGDRAYQHWLYPGWRCPDAWMAGANHYRWQWRIRYSLARVGWQSWSDWAPLSEPSITRDGNYSWVTDGIDTSYDTRRYNNAEVEIRVICCGGGGASSVHGGAASATHRNVFVPMVTFGACGVSPEGVRIDYTTNYVDDSGVSLGENHIYVTGVHVNGGANVLAKEQEYHGLDSDSSILIPRTALTADVPDGATVTLDYQVGNDQMRRWTYRTWNSAALTAQYDGGNTPLEIAMEPTRGRLLDVSVRHLGTSKLYMLARNGVRWDYEPNHVADGRAHFLVDYPFNAGFDLYVTSTSVDSDTWGVEYERIHKGDAVVSRYSPAHCWAWDGGRFMLECDASQMQASRKLSPEYAAHTLNGRSRQAVTYGTTVKSSFVASGALIEGVTEYGVSDLLAMQAARHVRYRSPGGDIAEVAITDVSYTDYAGYTDASVSMVEE